jgi:hypothetical protein
VLDKSGTPLHDFRVLESLLVTTFERGLDHDRSKVSDLDRWSKNVQDGGADAKMFGTDMSWAHDVSSELWVLLSNLNQAILGQTLNKSVCEAGGNAGVSTLSFRVSWKIQRLFS